MGEPAAKRMRGEGGRNFGNAPWQRNVPMGVPPKGGPPQQGGFLGYGGQPMGDMAPQVGGGVTSKSTSKSGQSYPQFKGAPPTGPPGPPPKAGGSGWLFAGGSMDNMQFQLQNETERLRQERLKMEEERKQLEEMMAQREREEEERRRLEEETERLRIEREATRKLQEEKRKEEAERKKVLAEELAATLQTELETLVSAAETLTNSATENVAVMEAETDDDDIIRSCEELETEIKDSKGALKICSDFIGLKHLGLIGAADETRQKAIKFRVRTQEASRNAERDAQKVGARKRKAIASKEAEARRVAAVKAAEKQENMFKQYDIDGDGKLNAVEMMEFVKGEYDFEFPLDKAEAILKQDAFTGQAGVPYLKFPHLKMLIGIARNEAMARKRKIEKDEKEKADKVDAERRRLLAIKQTAQVLEGVKIVETAMSGIEAEVVKAEEKAKPLQGAGVRGRQALSQEMIQDRADEVEQAVDAARDFLAAAKDQAASMAGVSNDKLEPTVIPGCAPARQLFFRLEYMEKRLALASKAACAARDRVILAQKKAQLMREAQEAAFFARRNAPQPVMPQLVQSHGMPQRVMPPMQMAPAPVMPPLQPLQAAGSPWGAPLTAMQVIAPTMPANAVSVSPPEAPSAAAVAPLALEASAVAVVAVEPAGPAADAAP